MRSPSRVVIDTAVFLSALILRSGASHKAVRRAFERCIVVSSMHQQYELMDPLLQTPLRKIVAPGDVQVFLDCLEECTEYFDYQGKGRDLLNITIVDLAVSANATYLVTGDKALVASPLINGLADLRILLPADFLQENFDT